jgi:hypothetical protein
MNPVGWTKVTNGFLVPWVLGKMFGRVGTVTFWLTGGTFGLLVDCDWTLGTFGNVIGTCVLDNVEGGTGVDPNTVNKKWYFTGKFLTLSIRKISHK